MFDSLPAAASDFMKWTWTDISPYYDVLIDQEVNASNVMAWMANWSRLSARILETYQRLYVSITVNTADPEALGRYETFLDHVYPRYQAAEQRLKEKLLASGFIPDDFEIPLRNMRTQADLFREVNLPLLSEELKLSAEYDKIIGAQTVEWEGKEITISQLQPVYLDSNRSVRERAWRMAAQRQLEDREGINQLWAKFLDVRGQLAVNAGMANYRDYRWQQLLRYDYTPQDCQAFHEAIELVVVPAASRAYEKRRQRLGVEALRPWDLNLDPTGMPPLRPFVEVEELVAKTAAIFHQVDPQLGAFFEIMRQENLLDLENRKDKAPGGYCTEFVVAHRPYIFMNSVGIHDDVQTLLHEGGHAFHVFESAGLPFVQQLEVGIEFAEVASMGMELLSAPYLAERYGGFYSEKDAARARIENLEASLLFWPYMAVVDAFQHWVYENQNAASESANCDRCWSELWERFMPGVDWSGLEDALETGWQRKGHIHEVPFYYIEYGLAQLGAVQIWRAARVDQSLAVANYRKALSLGGTVALPQLYAAAGARFAFDRSILEEAVQLIENTIEELELV